MDEERVKQINKCKAIMDAVFSMGASYQIASSVIEMQGTDPDTADRYAEIASQLMEYSKPLGNAAEDFNLVEYLLGIIKIISNDDLAPFVQNYFNVESAYKN
ncbi:MAG: hypothetical protein GYA36_05280 [Veillonellaceae bacterium]|jgi:hypothetical protein|nr:hypothetical protein [Veillonellaceae bacterium]